MDVGAIVGLDQGKMANTIDRLLRSPEVAGVHVVEGERIPRLIIKHRGRGLPSKTLKEALEFSKDLDFDISIS